MVAHQGNQPVVYSPYVQDQAQSFGLCLEQDTVVMGTSWRD
jgi:hypothetical protein